MSLFKPSTWAKKLKASHKNFKESKIGGFIDKTLKTTTNLKHNIGSGFVKSLTGGAVDLNGMKAHLFPSKNPQIKPTSLPSGTNSIWDDTTNNYVQAEPKDKTTLYVLIASAAAFVIYLFTNKKK